jgi:hypothetical protein
MPGGNQTGPQSLGAMTGRRMGFCAGYNSPGYANPGPGRFLGCGFGRGFGWRRWNFAPAQPVQYPQQPVQPTKEQELSMLREDSKAIEQEQKALNQELDAIKKRIEELKKEN